VHGPIEESEEPQHPAQLHEPGEGEDLPERSDREREDQEYQGEYAGRVDDELDGVGPEVSAKGVPGHERERQQPVDEDDEFSEPDVFHPVSDQKFALRSIPA
jgi:hypothetical protein